MQRGVNTPSPTSSTTPGLTIANDVDIGGTSGSLPTAAALATVIAALQRVPPIALICPGTGWATALTTGARQTWGQARRHQVGPCCIADGCSASLAAAISMSIALRTVRLAGNYIHVAEGHHAGGCQRLCHGTGSRTLADRISKTTFRNLAPERQPALQHDRRRRGHRAGGWNLHKVHLAAVVHP